MNHVEIITTTTTINNNNLFSTSYFWSTLSSFNDKGIIRFRSVGSVYIRNKQVIFGI